MRVIVSVETLVRAWQVDVDLASGAAVLRRDHRSVATAHYLGDGTWIRVTPDEQDVRSVLGLATREIARFDAVLRDARAPATHPY
jgi:hypothetical protein